MQQAASAEFCDLDDLELISTTGGLVGLQGFLLVLSSGGRTLGKETKQFLVQVTETEQYI